jgi:hypothetical protein
LHWQKLKEESTRIGDGIRTRKSSPKWYNKQELSAAIRPESQTVNDIEPSSTIMSLKPLPVNAESAISRTDAGIVIDRNDEQSQKAFDSTAKSLEGETKTNSEIQLHEVNAPAQIRSI